ncbi:MAG TPA: hypothetical protein VFE92_04630, partial [Dermatophilaceae bacterium]|nr:hypothetical protein [Dermatophilaceae bacterium]
VYMPFVSASTMAGGSSYSMPPLPVGLNPLPFAGVAALLVAIAWLISAVAAHTTTQRDIT